MEPTLRGVLPGVVIRKSSSRAHRGHRESWAILLTTAQLLGSSLAVMIMRPHIFDAAYSRYLDASARLRRRSFALDTLNLLVVGIAVWPRRVWGQAAPAPTVEELARGRTDFHAAIGGPAELITLRVTLPPGGVIPWHLHPGPVQAVLLSGDLTILQSDGCTAQYHAGDAAFLPAGTVHEEHNDGAVPIELVVSYLVPEGTPARVPADAPPSADCP
jgi:quercetin dioxygenase-like cupin family protein